MDEWPVLPFRDLMLVPTRNGIHKGPQFQGRGTPVIKMGEVYSAAYVGERERDLYDLTVPEKERFAVLEGDLLFCRTSLVAEGVGRCAMVRSLTTPSCFASNLIRVRIDRRRSDPRFMHFFFRSPAGRALVRTIARGTTVTTITGPDLGALPVPVPSLTEQQRIGDLLGCIDAKIEANQRQMRLLDQMLAALFASCCSGVGTAGALSSLATFDKGVSYRSTDLAPSRTAMVTLKSFDRVGGYRPDGLKEYVGEYKRAHVLAPGDIAVAQTDLTQAADVVGRTIRIPPSPEHDILVASLDLIVVRPRDGVPAEYVYAALLEDSFREYCRSRTSGTTVLHLATDALPSYQLNISSADAQQTFAAAARPLLAKRDLCLVEARSLDQLLGLLMPQILSGRLRYQAPVGDVVLSS